VDRKSVAGWIRPDHLELQAVLDRRRPRGDAGVLLSPFDPLLWDRKRTLQLFGFEQVLEIYKPARLRRHGYYCLPVLAGEHLVARVDLKADRSTGQLHTLVCHYEQTDAADRVSAEDRQAVTSALQRFARSVGLTTTCQP
jgi:hypothetical protein